MIMHRKEHTGVLSVAWHPQGDFLASGDYGHDGEGIPTLLQFWNNKGGLIKEMKGSKMEYRNIRWNKDAADWQPQANH
jgi:WD40 repeat protein